MKQLIFAVLALSLLIPAVPMAHPGHDHKLMGTISSIDKNKIVMKTTEGKDMTFEVTPTTTFKRGTAKGTQTDLKAGMRVVVNVGDGVEPLKAKEVQYSATDDHRQAVIPARARPASPKRSEGGRRPWPLRSRTPPRSGVMAGSAGRPACFSFFSSPPSPAVFTTNHRSRGSMPTRSRRSGTCGSTRAT